MAPFCLILGTFPIHDLASMVIRKLTLSILASARQRPLWFLAGVFLCTASFSARRLLLRPERPSPSPCEHWDLHSHPLSSKKLWESPSAPQPGPRQGRAVGRSLTRHALLRAQGLSDTDLTWKCGGTKTLQSWQETFKVISDVSGVRVPFFTLHGTYTSSSVGI